MTTAHEDLVAAIKRLALEELNAGPMGELVAIVVQYNEVADDVLRRVATGEMRSVRTAEALRAARRRALALGL